MKRSTLLLAFAFTLQLSAQDYHQFIHEDNRWMVSWDLNTTIWDADLFYEYVFGADTLINDTSYTIVWRNHYARTGEEGGFETILQPFEPGDQDELAGFVREDILNQRVYYRSENDTGSDQEFLLYDFSLQVGDVFYDSLVDSGPYTVIQVDTLNLYQAQRRVWTFDNGSEIIEGVGSNLGPFEGFTLLISGAIPQLYQFCQGPTMDCHVAVDGLVNNRRQINLRYTIPSFEGPWTYRTVAFRFVDTIHLDGHVFWALDPPGAEETPAYFRQDGAKVYRYYPIYDPEVILLYDFALENPFYTYNGTYPNDFSISYDLVAPQTFELDNGEIRNSLYFLSANPQAPWQESMDWVDGIGAIQNPLFPEEYFTPVLDIVTSELVCFYDDYENEAIYLNPKFRNCAGDLINSTEEQTSQPFQLYPNPTSGIVQLDFPVEQWQMMVFDLLGRQVATVENRDQIDLSAFAAGTYYYQIMAKNGEVLRSGKLIKH